MTLSIYPDASILLDGLYLTEVICNPNIMRDFKLNLGQALRDLSHPLSSHLEES